MKHQLGYPLNWPARQPRTRVPQDSRFLNKERNRPSPGRARDIALLELERLEAELVIVSTNKPLQRSGAWNDARREPDDCGAAIYFTLHGQRKVLACDKWKTVGENLHAIAKTIEATRGIERWGSVTNEQAFAGYVALQEKTQATCWELLDVSKDGLQLANEEGRKHAEQIILAAWREKVKAAHPQNGGSEELFTAVNAAKDMALQIISQ